MTLVEIWAEHRTKILGYSIATAGFISTTIASGTFVDLMQPSTIKWMGIACGFVITVFGGGTVAVGSNNTANLRVAEARATVASAMQDAINATPGDPIEPPH